MHFFPLKRKRKTALVIVFRVLVEFSFIMYACIYQCVQVLFIYNNNRTKQTNKQTNKTNKTHTHTRTRAHAHAYTHTHTHTHTNKQANEKLALDFLFFCVNRLDTLFELPAFFPPGWSTNMSCYLVPMNYLHHLINGLLNYCTDGKKYLVF
jgi:hypothetical protein